MKKEEIIEKAQKKKVVIGEMEQSKLTPSNWIAIVSAGVLAIAFIFLFSILGQRECVFAIASICFTWASVFYFCQYFVAKRPWQVLIGAVLHTFGACIMIANTILVIVGVI